MSKNFTVSQSKVKTYRRCRYAYHLKYVEGLRRKISKRPFKFGGIVHKMLEAHANGDDPFLELRKINLEQAKLFDAEKELYGNIINDIGNIMEEYFDYWEEDDITPIRVGKSYAEHPFEIEIEPGLSFKGQIDEFDRTKNKLRWLTDHKTFTKLPDEETRWINIQSSVYIRANDILGWVPNLAGTCWNYVKSKPPTRPELLKTGGLSQKNIDTLPSVVYDVMRKYKLKPKDNSKLIKHAEDNRSKYFFRIFTPISKKVVDNIFSGFVDTAREISECHGTKKDKNIDLHCKFCDYSQICKAELTGSDVDFVKEREYTVDDKKDEEEIIE